MWRPSPQTVCRAWLCVGGRTSHPRGCGVRLGNTGTLRQMEPRGDQTALRAMFASLRGEEGRLRRPPPDGAGAVLLAEGARLVERTQQAGHHLNALLVSTKFSGALPPGDHEVLVLEPDEIHDLTGFGAMREMLGAFDRPPDADPTATIANARRVLVLEGVANPSNVGTIIRTAVALGIDATLVGPGSSDPFGRRALRASMGAALVHPWAPDKSPIDTCRANGITTLALTPSTEASPLPEVLAARATERVALLVGAEGPGLAQTSLEAADECVTIPMHAGVDSLNVAAAAAIACFLMTTQ